MGEVREMGMSERDRERRTEVVLTAQATVTGGLNHGMTGNVSARTSFGCWITPSAVGFEQLTPERMVAIDLDGTVHDAPTGHRPSSEWRFHTAIYARHPEAGAVIHCHPIHATAISCLRESIPAFHYLVPMLGGADVRCSGYAPFGSPELAEAMLDALEGRRACLLANHGIVGYGDDLDDALAVATTLEVLARHYTVARSLGQPVVLDDREVDDLVARFADYRPPPST
jgi:L-fuculose-phosphate aldolase